MATYLPGVKQYVPQLQTFTPDYKFLQDVLTKRQDRYTTNYNELNDLYGKVVYADLSREDNQQVRDQYANQLTSKLEQVSGMDLSLQQNVEAAKALFRPFYEDKHIVKDILFTKTFADQQRHAQSLMNSPDPKIRKKYWDYGMEGLQMDMDKFKEVTREETLGLANPSYVENVDLVERGIEALKESGMSITKTTPVGDWLVTVKNGPNLTSQIVGYEKDANGEDDLTKPITVSPAMDYLQQTLLEDPLVIRAYALKAKVDGHRYGKANADKFGSYDAALKEWAKATLDKFERQDEKLLAKVQSDLVGATSDYQSWERYKEKMGIVPGSIQEEQLMRKQFNKRLLNQVMNSKVKNNKEVHQPATNLQNYLALAYKAQMMNEIGGDMSQAAIAYSNIDYEETFEANPFSVKKHEHIYRMKEKQFQHDLDMIKQADKYNREMLLKDAEGGDGLILGFDEVVYGEDGQATELSGEGWFDRTLMEKRDAYISMNSKQIDVIKSIYDGSQSFSDQYRNGNANGMITYNRSVTDESGQVLRTEEVTSNFEDFAADMMKFENSTELNRIYNHALKTFESVDQLNDGTTERSNADRLLDPMYQKTVNRQIRAINGFQERMNLADETINSAVYQQYRMLTDQENQTGKTGGNKGGYAGHYKEKGIGSRKWGLFGRGTGEIQEQWGMAPIVMPEKLVNEMMNGELYNDKKNNYKYDDYVNGEGLTMLSESQYVQAFINSLSGQLPKLEAESNNKDNWKLGKFKEKKSELLTVGRPWFFGGANKKKYGDRLQSTILGKFWDYNNDTGEWVLDTKAADYYAREYYNQQKKWLGNKMIAANAGQGGLPTGSYYALLNGLPGGDSAGDAIYRGHYTFTYDHRNNKSEGSRISANELNNITRIINMGDEWHAMDVGRNGSDLPWGSPHKGDDDAAKNEGKWDKQKRQEIAYEIWNAIQLDLRRKNNTATAPVLSITRREDVADGGGEYGSYEIQMSEEYAKVFEKKETGIAATDNEAYKDFLESRTITFYFKKEMDNSPYRISEREYSDIKILVDRDGYYNETYDKAGNFSITKNNNGQYEVKSSSLRFDQKSGTLVPGPRIDRVVNPTTMNLDMLVQNLDEYFEDIHKHNLENEVNYNKSKGIFEPEQQ